ncbi:MAG TPA: hypothetical protein VHU91_00900 [Mycobacteriales bacterium]|nr:hypothetical protein [Mycobacteriales bacterium]
MVKTDILSWVREQWDRCAAWLAVIAGVILLVLGWVGVSGTAFTANQIPYLASDGLGGIFLLGLGAMLWLSADLRDEWRKLDLIENKLDRIEHAVRENGAVELTIADLRVENHHTPMSAPEPAAATSRAAAVYR